MRRRARTERRENRKRSNHEEREVKNNQEVERPGPDSESARHRGIASSSPQNLLALFVPFAWFKLRFSTPLHRLDAREQREHLVEARQLEHGHDRRARGDEAELASLAARALEAFDEGGDARGIDVADFGKVDADLRAHAERIEDRA